jgi:hypothetical protein
VFSIARLIKRMSATPVFCFWEPYGSMPPYLRLCMASWANIRDAEIVYLDYSNMNRFIKTPLHENMKTYSLPQQADAIRFAILAEQAGLWMDCDTILTKNPDRLFNKIGQAGLVFVGNPDANATIALIGVRDRKNAFMRDVADAMRSIVKHPAPQNAAWDHVAAPYHRSVKDKSFFKHAHVMDWIAEGAILERVCTGKYGPQPYRDFWFLKPDRLSDRHIAQGLGLVVLHNSWTPLDYKLRSGRYILHEGQEVMSQFLRYALMKPEARAFAL